MAVLPAGGLTKHELPLQLPEVELEGAVVAGDLGLDVALRKARDVVRRGQDPHDLLNRCGLCQDSQVSTVKRCTATPSEGRAEKGTGALEAQEAEIGPPVLCWSTGAGLAKHRRTRKQRLLVAQWSMVCGSVPPHRATPCGMRCGSADISEATPQTTGGYFR